MRIASLLLAAALLAPTACAPVAPGSGGTIQPAAVAEGVTRLRIGDLDAWSIQDASAERPNDGKTLAIGEDKAAVDAVLTAAGAPTDALRLDANVLIVRTGDRVVMIDSGTGTAFGAPGRLPERLAATGLTADAVTDIVITHSHGDHVGGLVRDGRLAFPNARIHISADEWTFLQGQAPQAALVAAIRPRVNAIQTGAQLAPGVRAVAIEGHTPGHTGVEIASAGQRVLAVGDMVHHYVISVRKPEWTIAFDRDADTAEASRRRVLSMAAEAGTIVFAPHFPAPGLGRIRLEGDGFAWVPLG